MIKSTLLKRHPWLLIAIFSCLALLLSGASQASRKNGFDLRGALVPDTEIHHGGPPRDGIPAIDRPRFVRASRADFLRGKDRVLGVFRAGVAKAYPIKILNWHEIVNDTVAGETVVVTFCPLCGTGVAFSGFAAGKRLSFGVSGLLYNSDVLLYDRQTESLWSQLLAKAISGPLKGSSLNLIPLEHTTWEDWRGRHPDSRLLSTDTGFRRDYDSDPYAGYVSSSDLIFPVSRIDPRFHPKERVLGVQIKGQYKAYPFAELSRSSGEISDTLAGAPIRVSFDDKHQTARVFDKQGRELPGIIAFWFAWYAFHPDTEVYRYRIQE